MDGKQFVISAACYLIRAKICLHCINPHNPLYPKRKVLLQKSLDLLLQERVVQNQTIGLLGKDISIDVGLI